MTPETGVWSVLNTSFQNAQLAHYSWKLDPEAAGNPILENSITSLCRTPHLANLS